MGYLAKVIVWKSLWLFLKYQFITAADSELRGKLPANTWCCIMIVLPTSQNTAKRLAQSCMRNIYFIPSSGQRNELVPDRSPYGIMQQFQLAFIFSRKIDKDHLYLFAFNHPLWRFAGDRQFIMAINEITESSNGTKHRATHQKNSKFAWPPSRGSI